MMAGRAPAVLVTLGHERGKDALAQSPIGDA
jgi:hypothetical protein